MSQNSLNRQQILLRLPTVASNKFMRIYYGTSLFGETLVCFPAASLLYAVADDGDILMRGDLF